MSLRIEDTIEWAEAATAERATLHAELARLRRMADAYAATNCSGACGCCNRYAHPAIDDHAADCDVAIHLGLPREET